MSKEENDGNIVIQGDVGETAQLQEEEERLAKKQAKEDVEVAEGQRYSPRMKKKKNRIYY
jgi:hypothetical protein